MKKFIKEFWEKSEKPSKCEWLVLMFILGFCFFTMFYTDIIVTYEEGLHLLDCVVSGNLLDFYNYSYHNSTFGLAPGYDLIFYIIFAVWGLPVWIFYKLFYGGEYDIFAVPVELWFKALLIVFLIIGIYFIKKIGESIGLEPGYAKWMIFAYLSSMLMVLPVFEVSQVDIISIAFILGGFYYYLEGNMKKFILYFAFAIPMKFFALFIFIPLVLYHEKRILHVLKFGILGMTIFLVVKIPFINSISEEIRIIQNLFNYDMLQRLMSYTAMDIDREFSIFIFAFALLCIYCFYKKTEEKKEKKQFSIYIGFAAFMLLFMLLAECHPYWIVFLAPFLILQIFGNSERLKINLILEIGFAITYIIDRMYWFWGIFGGSTTFDFLILQNWGPRNKFERIPLKAFLEYFEYENYQHACNGIFYACAVALLIINFPRKTLLQENKTIKMERGLMWARVGLLLIYVVAEVTVILLDKGTGIL